MLTTRDDCSRSRNERDNSINPKVYSAFVDHLAWTVYLGTDAQVLYDPVFSR